MSVALTSPAPGSIQAVRSRYLQDADRRRAYAYYIADEAVDRLGHFYDKSRARSAWFGSVKLRPNSEDEAIENVFLARCAALAAALARISPPDIRKIRLPIEYFW